MGRPATEFKLSASSPHAVFGTPIHDFPKIITSELSAPNTLTASIDGGEKTAVPLHAKQDRHPTFTGKALT